MHPLAVHRCFDVCQFPMIGCEYRPSPREKERERDKAREQENSVEEKYVRGKSEYDQPISGGKIKAKSQSNSK